MEETLHLSEESEPSERRRPEATGAPTALLIGSWKCEPHRPIRDPCDGGEDAAAGEHTVSRKRGIRKVLRKYGGWSLSPDAWIEGDLQNMNGLMQRKGVEVFDVYSYWERNKDGVYSVGKKAVMTKIEDFFNQDDKTDFILYFTGHGTQEGSWVIPVTTAFRKKKRDQTGDGVHPSRSQSYALSTVSERDVCSDSSSLAESRARLKSDTPVSVACSTPSLSSPGASISCMTPVPGGNVKLVSLYEKARRLQPAPTKIWNDLITYEDVVRTWDESCGKNAKTNGKKRRLMMILECCHSGRWVQKVNGEIETMETDLDRDSIDIEITKRYPERHDISVQASCGPSETTSVAENQLSSVFTRAFVSAQNRHGFEKMVLTFFDHVFVLNLVSIGRSPEGHRFSPIRSKCDPFCGVQFFDSFDDMHLDL